MQLITSSWQDWMKYAHSDPHVLSTRNLIDTDSKAYSLLLCWNPVKESPIHDQPSDGSWVKLSKGLFKRYRQLGKSKDSSLYCYQESTARAGDVTYIDDTQSFHKVGNPVSHISATLHLYSPPALQCKTWPTESGMPLDACMKNYSEYSRKI